MMTFHRSRTTSTTLKVATMIGALAVNGAAAAPVDISPGHHGGHQLAASDPVRRPGKYRGSRAKSPSQAKQRRLARRRGQVS